MRPRFFTTVALVAAVTAPSAALAETPIGGESGKPAAPAPSPAPQPQKPQATPAKAPIKRVAKKKEALPSANFPGFEMVAGGGSRVFVDVNGPIKVTEHLSPGSAVYLIENARVDGYNNGHSLETFYYNTPALRVKLRQLKNDIELAITLRAEVKPTQKVVDVGSGWNRLEIDFAPGSYVGDTRDIDTPPPDPPRVKEKTDPKDAKKKAPAAPKPAQGPQKP